MGWDTLLAESWSGPGGQRILFWSLPALLQQSRLVSISGYVSKHIWFLSIYTPKHSYNELHKNLRGFGYPLFFCFCSTMRVYRLHSQRKTRMSHKRGRRIPLHPPLHPPFTLHPFVSLPFHVLYIKKTQLNLISWSSLGITCYYYMNMYCHGHLQSF